MGNPGVVDCMLSFLVGQGLFVSAVCKPWQESYARAVAKSSRAPNETLYIAAFESASRILVAIHGYKFIFDDKNSYLAGLHADAKTLRRAFALGMPMNSAVATGAAESGRLSTLQCAHSLEKCPLPNNIAAIAARLGDIAMLAWLLSIGHKLQGGTMKAALAAGNINVLDFLHEKECQLDGFAYDNAANAEVAQWLYVRKGMSGRVELQRANYTAAEQGKLDILHWTREKNVPYTNVTMRYAASAGTKAIPTMQYLLSEGCIMDTDDCYSAAVTQGSVDVLEWLTQEHNATFSEDSLEVAASEGHINVCIYLRQQGCAWDAAACTAAASCEHFDALKWLVEQGCPLEADACTSAARSDTLDMLKFLRLHNCPWNASTFTAAVWHENMVVLEWLFEQHCPWSVATLAAANSLSSVQWLHQRGCPWDASVSTAAASKCNLDILQWLYSNGCDLDTEALLQRCLQQMHAYANVDNYAAVLQWVKDTCGATTWSSETLTTMLSMCGAYGSKNGAIWLRTHTTAQFPELLYFESGDNSAQWTDTMVAWARAEGCISLVPQMLD
jgi:hypothetical protein